MKIGVFDSGLGGLIVLKSMVAAMPKYDYVYLGDTKRLPYGNKSQVQILQYTKQGVDFLYGQGCELIVIACNTASAKALRKIQREYLPKKHAGKKVLGVLVPAVEAVFEHKKIQRVGLLATKSTVTSKAYVREFKKINPNLLVFQIAAPKLVPLIEQYKQKKILSALKAYVQPLVQQNVNAVVLGCTHYSLIKAHVRTIVGPDVRVLSQDEIVPDKLRKYLRKHPEIQKHLSTRGSVSIHVTKVTPRIKTLAKQWFGKTVNFKFASL